MCGALGVGTCHTVVLVSRCAKQHIAVLTAHCIYPSILCSVWMACILINSSCSMHVQLKP